MTSRSDGSAVLPGDCPVAPMMLTLMSRNYCHLCEDMISALMPLAEQYGASISVVDIDTDTTLEARYGERVPVLLHGTTELCHYFLEPAKVRDYLSKIR